MRLWRLRVQIGKKKLQWDMMKVNVDIPSLSFHLKVDNAVEKINVEEDINEGTHEKVVTLPNAGEDARKREGGAISRFENVPKMGNAMETWRKLAVVTRTPSLTVDHCPCCGMATASSPVDLHLRFSGASLSSSHLYLCRVSVFGASVFVAASFTSAFRFLYSPIWLYSSAPFTLLACFVFFFHF
ncbi:hypothetical protein RJT34_23470 [Clitoria ternatea]|uniref:Uncharacterized protein n=1 Tax=Clitoria ternatea TaxID=43366 RepID=A0AAN9FL19_CLITE